MNPAQVVLLTRQGCSLCERTAARLAELADELGFELTTTDVDAEAAAGDPALRAEFGDRLPVVLLDGKEHSYWELDEPCSGPLAQRAPLSGQQHHLRTAHGTQYRQPRVT